MMNICIIGVGKMGETHLDIYRKIGIKNNIYLIDNDEQRGRSIAKKYQAEYINNYEDFSSRNKVDLTDICLPNYLHFEYIKKAIKIKSHIIVEKPPVLGKKEYQELIISLKNYPKIFSCAFVDRYHQPFETARDFCGSSKIVSFSFHRWGQRPDSRSWLLDYKKSGGCLMDLGIHDLDFLCSLVKKINNISAVSLSGTNQSDLTIRLNNFSVGHISSGWSLANKNPIKFYNSFQIATVNGLISYDSISNILSVNNTLIEISERRYPDAYQKELSHLLNRIQSNDLDNTFEVDQINKTMNIFNKI